MPITYMDDRPEKLPEIGHLRKGTKKKKITNKQGREVEIQGDDLKYFRFDTQDTALEARFASLYPHEPNNIEVILPYGTINECFDYWHEEYSAGALRHRCDSETCVLSLQPDGTYSTAPTKCPGGCKATARLHVLIPALGRLGTITVSTTSGNDIRNLRANLKWLYSQRGNLSGMPLILRRVEKEISTPEIDRQGNRTGKRLRRKKWLIQIEMQEQFATALLQAQQERALAGIAGALPPAQQLALNAAPEDLDGEEDDDAVEGEIDPAESLIGEINGIWIKMGGTEATWNAYVAKYLDGKPVETIEKRLAEVRAKADKKRAEAEANATPDDLLATIERECAAAIAAGAGQGDIDDAIAATASGICDLNQIEPELLPAVLAVLIELRAEAEAHTKAKA